MRKLSAHYNRSERKVLVAQKKFVIKPYDVGYRIIHIFEGKCMTNKKKDLVILN